MNDLGPEAKTILDAARGAETLSRTNRNRIKHAVLLQVAALGAASTAAGGAAATSVVTKVTLIAVTATVLAGGSLSVWAWKARPSLPPAKPKVGIVTPYHSVAAPAPPAVVEEPRPKPVVADVRRREARGEARRSMSVSAPVIESIPTPAPANVGPATQSRAIQSLSPELTMLRQAQEDLRAGHPAEALRRLAEYDRHFVKGTLDQERRAIEAIATCQIRLDRAAQTRAESFLRSAPESPLAERVRAACKKLEGASKSFNEDERGRER